MNEEVRSTTQMRFDKMMDGVKGHFDREGHPVLDSHYTGIIKRILKATKAKKIMEIGMYAGHTVVGFLDADEDVVVHAIDICDHDHVHACASRIMKAYGKSRFSFGEMDSTTMGLQSLEGYDLVRIDGGHSTEVLQQDCIRAIASKVPWIIIDDMGMKNVREFVSNQILENGNCPYINAGKSIYNNSDGGHTYQILLERISEEV